MKNRNLWRKVSSSTLSFFLALMIVTIGLTIGLRIGVFGNATIEKAIIESNYYEESYHNLVDQVEWFLSDTSVPVEVILSDLTIEQFYIDARTQTQSLLQGTETTLLTELIKGKKQAILENLTYEYEKRNIELTTDQLDRFEKISELTSQLYQEQLEMSLMKEITKARNSFESVGLWIVLGAVMLSGFVIGLLLKMYHHKYKAIRYVVYSVISASSMLLVSALWMRYQLDYSSIIKDRGYYQRFIEVYTKESGAALLYPAGCGIIISCLLLFLIKELRKRAIGE